LPLPLGDKEVSADNFAQNQNQAKNKEQREREVGATSGCPIFDLHIWNIYKLRCYRIWKN
jgi:hypothetical protein